MFQFLGGVTKSQKTPISFVLSVCPSVRPCVCIGAAPTGRISLKFCYWWPLCKAVEKFWNLLKIGQKYRTLHEDLRTIRLLGTGRKILLSPRRWKGTHCLVSVSQIVRQRATVLSYTYITFVVKFRQHVIMILYCRLGSFLEKDVCQKAEGISPSQNPLEHFVFDMLLCR